MVSLCAVGAMFKNWHTITDNIIVINPKEAAKLNVKQVTVEKSNGQCYVFNVFKSNEVPKGCMSFPEMVRVRCRFHRLHNYRVSEKMCSVPQKKTSIDITKIGIIGQDEAIYKIMSFVFEPRQFSAQTHRDLNLKLFRGVVLYGPPGTGKTSIVRGICSYLQIEPRVVNGPELLDQYVGSSERAVCELFDKALADQMESGDKSPLHVIVLDEMDALFPLRSPHSGESNTRNTVVSQMLTMMDGYTQLNNFVVFGTTNRLDMIDSALLHSGRFDLKIKIDLPDAQGRFEILKFLINQLKNNGRLASDITEPVLAEIAKDSLDYSGADMAQLVQYASLFALKRITTDSEIDINGKRELDGSKVIVGRSDIIVAQRTIEDERRIIEQS